MRRQRRDLLRQTWPSLYLIRYTGLLKVCFPFWNMKSLMHNELLRKVLPSEFSLLRHQEVDSG